MLSNFIYPIICGLMNTAIFVLSSRDVFSKPEQMHADLFMLSIVAIAPAAISLLPAFTQTKRSKLLARCSQLTLASGALFTYIYLSTIDPSRILILAPHYALTYIFSFVSLFSIGNNA